VAATKINFQEQALLAGTKQSSQADKAADQQVRQADKAVRSACFVLDLLALFCAYY
jgi:hypothetical protein